MRRFSSLLLFAAALLGLAPGLRGAGPAAPAPHFRLTLARPMLTSGQVRLDPGTYDVVFEPSPMGMPHVIAAFSRGGARVATTPAELKGAPRGTKMAELTYKQTEGRLSRKDGSIHTVQFDVDARSERAFYEALLTEFGIPETDASSKAPATVILKAPRGLPSIVTPAPTPAKK